MEMVDDGEKYKKLLKLLGFLSSSHASQSFQTRGKSNFQVFTRVEF